MQERSKSKALLATARPAQLYYLFSIIYEQHRYRRRAFLGGFVGDSPAGIRKFAQVSFKSAWLIQGSGSRADLPREGERKEARFFDPEQVRHFIAAAEIEVEHRRLSNARRADEME